MARKRSNGNSRLDEAMAMLIQNQTSFLSRAADADRRIADANRDIAKTRRDISKTNRRID